MTVSIQRLDAAASVPVDDLLALIQTSFAPMRGVIDPPSSAERLTKGSLAKKIAAETVFVADEAGEIVGCVFLAPRGDHLYLGKLAVAPARERRGIGRLLIEAAIGEARRRGLPAIELQTRVELTGNHAFFERLGFRLVGTTTHPGYARPTSRTYRLMV